MKALFLETLWLGVLSWICGAQETDVMMPAPLGLNPPIEIIEEDKYESDGIVSKLPAPSSGDVSTICTKGTVRAVKMSAYEILPNDFFDSIQSRGVTMTLLDTPDLAKMYACGESGNAANIGAKFALGDYKSAELMTLSRNEKALTLAHGTQLSNLVGTPVHFFPDSFNFTEVKKGVRNNSLTVILSLIFPRIAITDKVKKYTFKINWWPIIMVNTLLKDTTPIVVETSAPVLILYKATCAPIYENCYSETVSQDYEKSASAVYSVVNKMNIPTNQKASLKFQYTTTVYIPKSGATPSTFTALLYLARSAVRPACV